MEKLLKIHDKNNLKAVLLLLAAAFLWSTGGVLVKLVNWNPLAIAGSRSLISAIVLFLFIKKPRFTKTKAQMFGIVAYACTVISYVIANKMTTAANAILLQYTAPIFVAFLGAIFLKERNRWYDWLAVVFVIGGMMLFFVDNLSIGNMMGNFVAIASGFFFACLIVTMRYQRDSSPADIAFFGNILTFLVSIPFWGHGWFTTSNVTGILLLGVFQLGISYICYTSATKHISALEGSLILTIEPILNPLWAFLIIGEVPSFWALIGGSVVISALTIRSIYVGTRRETAAGGS